ncbi:MAG TPA: SDR family oxidoreductase [Acidimicrobiia bacterium]|jgi:NAD(P)-dependent dehydrogenase (short-subunit alcohol dehydrogenase family)|nr:SDR family oxidoreductase [Acidimicrobiia bacterium]
MSADGRLDGKVALITGGGSGIGRATCRRLADAGARVFVVDRDEASARAVAEEVGGSFFVADMGNSTEVNAAFGACVETFDVVDIAFLNAGISIGVADLTTLVDDDYHRLMRVNVDGVVFGLRAAIRAMEARGGAIVATSSLAGIIPFPPDPVYDASKHAVVGLVRSAAPTLVAKNITVNTVNPGIVDTNILTQAAKDALRGAGFPIMEPSQIADAVHGLVTSGVTGQCWVCQPGREAVPYAFRDVPGPRGGGTEGRRMPAFAADEESWATRS